MKIYVAAKFEEAPRARALMARVATMGHTVTYDWTQHEPTTPPDKLWICAKNDLQGVIDCDILVLLWHPGLKGGLVELGAALALKKKVIVVGLENKFAQPCVFFHAPGIVFLKTENGIAMSMQLSQKPAVPMFHDGGGGLSPSEHVPVYDVNTTSLVPSAVAPTVAFNPDAVVGSRAWMHTQAELERVREALALMRSERDGLRSRLSEAEGRLALATATTTTEVP